MAPIAGQENESTPEATPDLVLNIRKPIGWSSFDVVRYTKRIWPRCKVGHAGTLDPFAEGVLLVCVGKATKRVAELVQGVKGYRAEIRMGLTTDTLDLSGQTIERRSVPRLTRDQVETTLRSFLGKQMQKPPDFSALQIDGKRAYHLARSGKTIELVSRAIEIYCLALVDLSTDRLIIEVECSKGTYIRALARDIAVSLDTVGYVQNLLRTRVGDYFLRDACEIAELKQSSANCGKRP
ncbi:MAG TPA: tRNA pseudouridine(55) synthase TruB [bacterium]|mgnify:CR=1 FL=1|nr:tRNA pseudouridine(55) synthase TruB [bacterium]HNT66135.1 tRNA pseudouridine(55) synthase TruB [bacterium]HOX87063.1 tRNA pseudouridine(55) synthase TruB [bacterium]HPG46394.1 tRNA pseudouridine(55) synthase TruB [bacterium]HPM98692.1 tRNA pseudouridine(55) synthase TruB [bacterium]